MCRQVGAQLGVSTMPEVILVSEKRVVKSGKRSWTEYKVDLPLNEAAERAAIWMRLIRPGCHRTGHITGRVEIIPRGKNSPLRNLVILKDGEEIGKIGVTAFSKYFVYSKRDSDRQYYVPIKLDENGVHFWEIDGDSNWWALANFFCI